MTSELLKFLSMPVLVISATMLLCSKADAEEFIGFGVDLEHNKKRSSLCYSGGVSRNLTYTAKVMAGIESGDVRYYAFYKNEKCVLNGDIKDNERAYFVSGREESIGISFEWTTSF